MPVYRGQEYRGWNRYPMNRGTLVGTGVRDAGGPEYRGGSWNRDPMNLDTGVGTEIKELIHNYLLSNFTYEKLEIFR